jgi:uncharacterized protein YjbI with pentapeptide repeats/energy-coupling factor transporter ATP-binding protein EcfA2
MSRNALVVGINTYEQLPALRSPARDAEAIAQCLKAYGECSTTRLPEVIDAGQPKVGLRTKVTLRDLKTVLIQLFKPKGVNVPQTAIFFFSGHGIQDDSGIQEGFLGTSDADPSRGIYGLSLSWLRRLLQASPVRQKVIWLDCCNSGEFLNFQEADPGAIVGTDRLFMTASREYQPAFESLDSPYSIFTQALLKGLDPHRLESGVITNYALTDWVSNALKGEIQQPLFENSGSEIILTRTNWATQLTAATQQPVEKGVCPYKGLAFFNESDADAKYFYGRQELTDQLLDKVRQESFLAILGASGSGKSSLLRAGLLHQLQLGRRLSGSNQWKIHILVPGNHPLQSLALAFVDPQASELERAKQLDNAEELIYKGATGLRRLVQASSASRVVLAIDQFEEAFTLCQNNDERQQFFQCLLDGLAQTEKLCLILAMRADFLGKCLEQDYSGLAQQIQAHMVAVTPMSREELRQAIVEPARQVGLEIEPELVQEMLTDVEGAPGSLPLLQYTLTELWKYATHNSLDLKTYSQLGGVMGTLQQRATEVYEQFPDKQKPVVRHLFLALTQLGEGTEDTRRRVRQPELVNQQYSASLIDQVVQRLADEKLIVTNELIEKGRIDGYVSVIDISHETLIRHWTLLRQWIEENRDALRQERRIEIAAEEWRDRSQSNDYLLQGKPLQDALAFQQETRSPGLLSTLAEQFIQASVRQRQLNRWKFIGFAIVPVVALVAVPLLIGLITLQNKLRTAENEQQQALTEHIASVTQRLAGDRSGLSEETFQIVQNETRSIVPKLNASRKGQLLEFLRKAQLIYRSELDSNTTQCPSSTQRMISLNGAVFDGLEFNHPVLLDCSNLSRISLKGATLPGSSLVEADLRKSNLAGANLNNTLLMRAHLEDANLHQATLRGADLSGAFLQGTDLTQADLTNAKLTGAKYNSTTQFPTGFNPTAAGMSQQ